MKKIFGAVATVCCLAAAPAAFAGVDVFVEFGLPRPVMVAPPMPVVYYGRAEPRWHDRHGHFARHHEYPGRHEQFRRHDWR
jgi:hypothetical protein